MAVKVIKDQCISCSACLSSCPFGAIIMEETDNKAFITEACTACGACIDVCPVGAIIREEEAKTVAMDKNDYKGVWVYIEQIHGQARGVGHELLGEGRKLADALKQELAAVLIGENVEALAKDVFASGADKVYLVEGLEYRHYSTDAYTIAFTDLINAYRPSVILLGATNDGRDLGPRVAARVGTGLTADCTGLDID
ncbi:MAG: 4Fe-4S binding protein, partial [Negativicutes bacterium]|nr:4Fe-4S binding protein [Negativicutes bacterium]